MASDCFACFPPTVVFLYTYAGPGKATYTTLHSGSLSHNKEHNRFKNPKFISDVRHPGEQHHSNHIGSSMSLVKWFTQL